MNYLRTEAENDPPTHPKTLTPQANCATYPSPMSGPLDSVRFDLYYVENWSVMSDLIILWRTGRAVLGSSGAY